MPEKDTRSAPVGATPMDEFAFARVEDGHGGPGWYYWTEEYPDEGSVGAFETLEAARLHCFESVCDAEDKRIEAMTAEDLAKAEPGAVAVFEHAAARSLTEGPLMSAPTWKQVAKRWADGVLLDEAHSLLLVRWATTLAESQGTWSSVEDALEAEAGLHEADAQALALEVRRLVHRLAAAGADS